MSADEFDVIRKLFAPLATSAGARGLVDDAALLDDGARVVTTDAIVEGVHFLADDPIETIAAKALRVNISDLVGKGAKPHSALLSLVWPTHRPSEQIALFAEALGRDLQHYDMSLIGGDTTSTPGPLTISITAFGTPIGARTPSRADAKPGDDVWLVGGEIGTAWLGLQLRTGAIKLDDVNRGRDEAIARVENDLVAGRMPGYLKAPGEEFDAEAAWLISLSMSPFVRAECAPIVAKFANASMDVSDGLVVDAAKMAAASDAAINIVANDIPFSIPAQRWAFGGGDFRKLITGGDDYVFLFTAPQSLRTEIEAAEGDQALRLSRIGWVRTGAGVQILDATGTAVPIDEAGYAHKLGR